MSSAFDSFDQSALGGFVESTLGMRNGGVVWTAENWQNYIDKRSMTDLSILQTFNSPEDLSNGPGCGGKADMLLVTMRVMTPGEHVGIFELSPSDGSNIRYSYLDVSTHYRGQGIGGNKSHIWYCCEYVIGDPADARKSMELSYADFSVVRSVDSFFSDSPDGAGGDSARVWGAGLVGAGADPYVAELSSDDLTTIRSAAMPGDDPTGAGGSSSHLWYADATLDELHELSIADFSSLRSVDCSPRELVDCGGN